MKPYVSVLLLCWLTLGSSAFAQIETIPFELNGRNPKDVSLNPFGKFVGEWTLKDDNWTHNWGGETETIQIPGHHTVSRQLNTNNSLLSIIDGPEPNGHIFWSYNPNTGEVQHLSSFGDIRAGSGAGTVNEKGDVSLRLVFEGEPKGTYRIYHYKWINSDEYHMKSVQYNAQNEPTGLFYEGSFVRIAKVDEALIRQQILDHGQKIRDAFAAGDVEKIKSLHHPEVKKALGYKDLKNGREAVIQGVAETLKNYSLTFVKNEVESLLIQEDLVIEQTQFSIQGTPKAGGDSFIFSGRTMVTYVKYKGSPTGWATIREIIQPATE
ncbi:MAG: hypothetical protein AAFW00_23165 [Bacteroidota bacterium]